MECSLFIMGGTAPRPGIRGDGWKVPLRCRSLHVFRTDHGTAIDESSGSLSKKWMMKKDAGIFKE